MSTTTLHSEKKKALVPRLRFPGSDGEWEKKKLKDICTFFSGGTPTSTDKSLYNGNIPFIGSGNIYDSEVKNYITEKALNKSSSKMVEIGDLLYALYGANSGEVAISKMKGAINQAILCIRTKSEIIEFIYSLLLLNKDKIVAKYLQGGQGNLSADIIKKLKYSFPTLPEQQKIASFLSAVDEKIQQLSRKKELLEQYKKGVMQQLFSGILRFKDENGNDYADWKIIKVQELINKKAIISLLDGNHGALYPKSEEFAEKGVPYVAANNLVNGQVKFSECKYLPVERAKKFKKGIAKSGDVLFAHNATVGPTALLKTELDYIILSTTVTYYRCDLNILSNTYLLHYFNSDNFISQYSKVMSQSTRNQVPITMQKKFNIDFPCLEEQKKIANFLSSIDTKIENTNAALEKIQGFKKGLLQQMFV